MEVKRKKSGMWITSGLTKTQYIEKLRGRMARTLARTHSVSEIAELFNINKSTVSRMINKSIGKNK